MRAVDIRTLALVAAALTTAIALTGCRVATTAATDPARTDTYRGDATVAGHPSRRAAITGKWSRSKTWAPRAEMELACRRASGHHSGYGHAARMISCRGRSSAPTRRNSDSLEGALP